MKYRVRNNDGKLCYRKSIDGAVKVAADKGSIVECHTGYGRPWHQIGLAFKGVFYDSRKYVDAFKLFKGWRGPTGRPKFGFAVLVGQGEIQFPMKQCGLDNSLSWAKQVLAIRPGDLYDDSYDGVYHYVVTDYGRELAGIIRELFDEAA